MIVSVLTAPFFVLLIVTLSLGSYGIARVLLRNRMDEDTRDLAGSVLFRIASLHGLVLALVFAQDLSGIRDVSVSAAREATLVADLYYDADRYDGPESAGLQHAMARYAVLVTQEEWSLLADARVLSPDAWAVWGAAYEMLLDATPTSDRQVRLHETMLADVRLLAELRDRRGNVALSGAQPIFLYAALIGVVLVSAAYFPWPATALNLGLIGGFSGFTGLILYMIVAFSNPFSAPGRAPTVGFDRFLIPEVRELGARPFPAP